LNRADLLQVLGSIRHRPGAPETLGMEVSGTVSPRAADFAHSHMRRRRFVRLVRRRYAEYCIAHEGSVLPVPKERFSWCDAAALPEAYFTSGPNVVDRTRLAPAKHFPGSRRLQRIGTCAIQLFGRAPSRFRHRRLAREMRSLRQARRRRRHPTTRAKISSKVHQMPGGPASTSFSTMVGGSYVAQELQRSNSKAASSTSLFQEGAEVTLNMLSIVILHSYTETSVA